MEAKIIKVIESSITNDHYTACFYWIFDLYERKIIDRKVYLFYLEHIKNKIGIRTQGVFDLN